jgi:hypothetical protein
VARLGHDRLTRYFEFLDATEQAALDAAKAHFDVQALSPPRAAGRRQLRPASLRLLADPSRA